MPARLLIIVLAGGELRPSTVPDDLQQDETLTGPMETTQLQIGLCLPAELAEQFRPSDRHQG